MFDDIQLHGISDNELNGIFQDIVQKREDKADIEDPDRDKSHLVKGALSASVKGNKGHKKEA